MFQNPALYKGQVGTVNANPVGFSLSNVPGKELGRGLIKDYTQGGKEQNAGQLYAHRSLQIKMWEGKLIECLLI